MEVKGKGLSFGVLVTLTILLHAAEKGRATDVSLKEFNGTADRFSTIAHHNMELEFLMESETEMIRRMLATQHGHVTDNTKKSDRPAVDCGRGNPYKPCTPHPNNPKNPQQCNIYNRNC